MNNTAIPQAKANYKKKSKGKGKDKDNKRGKNYKTSGKSTISSVETTNSSKTTDVKKKLNPNTDNKEYSQMTANQKSVGSELNEMNELEDMMNPAAEGEVQIRFEGVTAGTSPGFHNGTKKIEVEPESDKLGFCDTELGEPSESEGGLFSPTSAGVNDDDDEINEVKMSFDGESADEVALLSFAQNNGFQLYDKSDDSIILRTKQQFFPEIPGTGLFFFNFTFSSIKKFKITHFFRWRCCFYDL